MATISETPGERTVRMHFATCVEEMFDDYADDFESELRGDLGYRMPEEITKTLVEALAAGSDGMLSRTVCVDLGAGTGLAGATLKPHCTGKLVGCDLSGRMLAVAQRKKIFDDLQRTDVVAYLHKFVQPAGCDLIVAADVLVYMRPLTDLFSYAADRLSVGGVFAFSTEKCEAAECGAEGAPAGGDAAWGAGWVERPSERIAHCDDYLRWLVGRHADLEIRSLHEATVRRDEGKGIKSSVCIVVKLKV